MYFAPLTSLGLIVFFQHYAWYDIPGIELWKFLNLGILCTGIYFLVKKIFIPALAARREAIREELAKAKKERDAANAKLADGSVTEGKIADGAITPSKLSASATPIGSVRVTAAGAVVSASPGVSVVKAGASHYCVALPFVASGGAVSTTGNSEGGATAQVSIPADGNCSGFPAFQSATVYTLDKTGSLEAKNWTGIFR